ncbi:MAG: peptidoglycan-binding protein, partial [Clostridia bacterium]|nr:peptidoglycan-binding protein [Clostridia bacterium]
MKRLIALLLIALLLVPAVNAAAEAEDARMEAYINENGRISFVMTETGEEYEIAIDGVRKIVHVSDQAIFYTVVTYTGQTALYVWSPTLSARDSALLISDVSGDPVYVARDDAVYYLSAENPRQLMKCDAASLSGSAVRLLPSATCELRESMDGLYITVSGPWKSYFSRVLDASTNALNTARFDPDAVWTNFGVFETQLTVEGGLELRMAGESEWRGVTYDNVFAQAEMDGKLYYLMREGDDYTWLACYDPAAAAEQLTYVYDFNEALQPTLLAGEGAVFIIDLWGNVLALSPETGEFLGFWLAEDAPNAEMTLCDGCLLVYDTTDGAYALKLKEKLPWAAEKVVYNRLALGSRGEDVRNLQARLNALGYNAGKADGIFGANTQRAVVYFEDAIGFAQDGVATPELQQKLFAAGAPVYQEYIELARGGMHNGVRVRSMQERLRELGYLADVADGVFGMRTQAAVTLFQNENGLRATGVANVDTLRRLMSSDAAVCSSFIQLRKGDTGIRVTELQERLRKLGYMIGKASGEFDNATAEALRLFCTVNGVAEKEIADEAIQSLMFSRAAMAYTGYIELKYGDSDERVLNLQKRLAELGYYSGELRGNYRSQTREAVRLFQENNGLRATGVATVETQQRLFTEKAVPYTEPTAVPVPEPTAVPTPKPTEVTTPVPTPIPTPEPTALPTPK